MERNKGHRTKDNRESEKEARDDLSPFSAQGASYDYVREMLKVDGIKLVPLNFDEIYVRTPDLFSEIIVARRMMLMMAMWKQFGFAPSIAFEVSQLAPDNLLGNNETWIEIREKPLILSIYLNEEIAEASKRLKERT